MKNCFETVPAGHVKVATLFGKIKNAFSEGCHFANPLNAFHTYDVRQKTKKEAAPENGLPPMFASGLSAMGPPPPVIGLDIFGVKLPSLTSKTFRILLFPGEVLKTCGFPFRGTYRNISEGRQPGFLPAIDGRTAVIVDKVAGRITYIIHRLPFIFSAPPMPI